jgi:hypothetical protein
MRKRIKKQNKDNEKKSSELSEKQLNRVNPNNVRGGTKIK